MARARPWPVTQRVLFAQTIRVERNGSRDEPGSRLGYEPSGRCQSGDGLRDTRTDSPARRLNIDGGDGRTSARVMDLHLRRALARDRAGQRAQECGKKKQQFHQSGDVVAKPSRVQTPPLDDLAGKDKRRRGDRLKFALCDYHATTPANFPD